MHKDATGRCTLPTRVAQREEFDLLRAILVIGPNVPVVLLPAVKLEPVAGSRHTSGKPRTLTAGGPCVHIAKPWSLASALAPPGGKRLQAHPPAVCLTQVSTARLQAEIRGKAAAKRILPSPSSDAKSLMWTHPLLFRKTPAKEAETNCCAACKTGQLFSARGTVQ